MKAREGRLPPPTGRATTVSMMLRYPHLLLGIALAVAAAGCGATDPHVYKFDEFNRSAKDFNAPVTDREGVTFCYNGVGTTDSQIARMAETECARFGRVARFEEETFGDCPMLTPVQARFTCDLPAGAVDHPAASPHTSGG
jgi:hypothetical protein